MSLCPERAATMWLVVCTSVLGVGCIELPGALPPISDTAPGADASPTIDIGPPDIGPADFNDRGNPADMALERGPDQGPEPRLEACNGLDDDGDGAADEGVTNLCGACGELPAEVCDTIDNDCDLVIDEAADCDCPPGATEGCGTDVGECVSGQRDCGPNGRWTTCNAVAPTSETCNGLDDDCDGETDEGLLNACQRCGPPPDEVCNALDDDCDGTVDEGVLNDCGACGPPPREVCNDLDDDCDGKIDETLLNDCGACGPVPTEVCNSVDDDCDGRVDEDFPGLGEPCSVGEGACRVDGVVACLAPEIAGCDVDARGGGAEVCNQRDDDCDGDADEGGVCGLFAQRACRLFIGWAARRRGPDGPSLSWRGCPQDDRDQGFNITCAGTRGDGDFARIGLTRPVDEETQFAWALLCEDADEPELADWIQSHCALFAAYGEQLPDAVDDINGCPAEVQQANGATPCTSTGFDRRFRALRVPDGADRDAAFAFAWLCRDPEQPERAAAMSAAVDVIFGWATERQGPPDGAPVWGTCPPNPRDEDDEVRCVSTRGDQLFHRLRVSWTGNEDQIGIALKAR